MTAFLYAVTAFSTILVVLRTGILIGARKYGSEETEIGTEVIGLIPYLSIALWGITIIIKG